MLRTLKTLPLIIALTACAVETNNPTTLQPLDTPPTQPAKYTNQQLAYLDDFYYHFGKPTQQNNDTLIELAAIWCHAINMGMKATDVQERINEGAEDQQDAELNEAVVKAATTNLCPYQPTT
jgi:hypothetical protein